MTIACPFPGCGTLVLITADAERRSACSEHYGLELPTETPEQFMDRIRKEMGWKRPWQR